MTIPLYRWGYIWRLDGRQATQEITLVSPISAWLMARMAIKRGGKGLPRWGGNANRMEPQILWRQSV